jgi:hypothetical protein
MGVASWMQVSRSFFEVADILVPRRNNHANKTIYVLAPIINRTRIVW